MIRKVRVPLKLKLIVLITALLTASTLFYLFFALDLFKKDKSAYIYETNMTNAENLATQVERFISTAHHHLQQLASAYDKNSSPARMVEMFNTVPHMIEFSVYHQDKKLFYIFDKHALAQSQLPPDHFQQVQRLHGLPLKHLQPNKIYLENQTIPAGFPHFVMGIKKERIYLARIDFTPLVSMFRQNNIYRTYVLSNMGKTFLQQSIDQHSILQEDFPQQIQSGQIDSGVREFTHRNGKKYLTAFYKIKPLNLTVISEIEQQSAYRAANYLIKKSLFFGIFVITVAIIAGIIFARSLTAHLGKLFTATQKMADGDFKSQVIIKAHDEIGALSDSFNYMSQEIVRYMEEMRTKVRLENELAVAKLVQDSFFPKQDLTLPHIQLSSFYSPASECGGDWWSCIQHQHKTIILIADATGHGVPAAFLTATANACANNIKIVGQSDPSYLESPAKILSLMNHAICNIAEKIYMTCFVGIIDPQDKIFKFANASHNPPLLFRPTDNISKADFHPILKTKNPRLGHQQNATFEEAWEEVKENDSIIFFTDGIIECTDHQQKQWGQRNFIKSLIAHIQSPTPAQSVVKEAQLFCQGHPFDDDVTLVITRING